MGLFGNKVRTDLEIKNNVIKILKKQGISYSEELLKELEFKNVQLKSAEEIRKRAMASMLAIQLACSIREENYSDTLLFVLQTMKEWNLYADDFLPKEKLLILNQYTQDDNEIVLTKQDIVDVAWTYESYWSLIWALDLITDKELVNASKICNTERAAAISGFLNQTSSLRLRSIDKILEKVYLFYCYQWAFAEKEKNPDISTGNLNFEVVVERRRGLEWLIREETDWNDLILGTFHNA